jgi:hypothetical protein
VPKAKYQHLGLASFDASKRKWRAANARTTRLASPGLVARQRSFASPHLTHPKNTTNSGTHQLLIDTRRRGLDMQGMDRRQCDDFNRLPRILDAPDSPDFHTTDPYDNWTLYAHLREYAVSVTDSCVKQRLHWAARLRRTATEEPAPEHLSHFRNLDDRAKTGWQGGWAASRRLSRTLS